MIALRVVAEISKMKEYERSVDKKDIWSNMFGDKNSACTN